MFNQGYYPQNPSVMQVPFTSPYPGNYMMAPKPVQQSAKMNQPLTSEEIASLRNNNPIFSIAVPPEEVTRAICTHKNNNTFDLTYNNDGTVTCNICGKTFNVVDADTVDIRKDVGRVVDILQTAKLVFTDVPTEMAREFFPILPLIEKIPAVYEMAQKNFARYTNPNQPSQFINPQGNAFGMLGNITSGNYGYNPYQQQMMQPQMGQPQQMYGAYPQQPAYNPMYDPTVAMQQPTAINNAMPQMNPFQAQPMQMGYAQNPAVPMPQMTQQMAQQPQQYGFSQPQYAPQQSAISFTAANPNTPIEAPKVPGTDVTVTSELKV